MSAVTALAAGNAVFGPGLAGRMLDFFAVLLPSRSSPSCTARAGGARAPGARTVQRADRRPLVISPVTVRNHVTSILAKLQVTNRREAMLRFHAP